MLHQVFHQKPITLTFLARKPRASSRALRKSKALAFLEGRTPEGISSIVTDEFKVLGVEGVLIPRGETKIIARAQMISGAFLLDSDEQFLLFDVRK
jgi:hypothetical protein